MGNDILSGKQVGYQASRRVTRRLAWIQPSCLNKYKCGSRTERVKAILETLSEIQHFFPFVALYPKLKK